MMKTLLAFLTLAVTAELSQNEAVLSVSSCPTRVTQLTVPEVLLRGSL